MIPINHPNNRYEFNINADVSGASGSAQVLVTCTAISGGGSGAGSAPTFAETSYRLPVAPATTLACTRGTKIGTVAINGAGEAIYRLRGTDEERFNAISPQGDITVDLETLSAGE